MSYLSLPSLRVNSKSKKVGKGKILGALIRKNRTDAYQPIYTSNIVDYTAFTQIYSDIPCN